MKKQQKIGVTIICTIVFTIIFYDNYIGINFSILSLIIWAILNHFTLKRKKDKKYWGLSILLFLMALSQAWYGDYYSFSALFVTLSVVGLYAKSPRMNFILYPVIRLLNFFIFPFRLFQSKWLPKKKEDGKFFKKLLFFFLIPFCVTLIFLLVYSTGSSLIENFLEKLNLHIDFEMLGLFFLGWFLFFNFWITYIPKYLIDKNRFLLNEFSRNRIEKFTHTLKEKPLNFERKSGEITLILLNVILFIFIVTYNYEQFFTPTEAGRLSVETHARINTIIFSILMAIGIILFYFKSVFNFDKKTIRLRRMTFLWIILNGILVLSALMKISEYVMSYGLTFKRIGVYIFLFLCIIGLFFSFQKIRRKKTNIYLISRMAWSIFITFTVCSIINFSWIVTKFNLTFCDQPDMSYMLSLSYNDEILYQHFKNDAQYGNYLNKLRKNQKRELDKNFLSSRLLFSFLDIGKMIHEEPIKNQETSKDAWVDGEVTAE